jgi:hypothetical protein
MDCRKLILVILIVLFPIASNASDLTRDVVVDNIKYRLYLYHPNDGVEVPYYASIVYNEENPYSGDFVIPEKVSALIHSYGSGYEDASFPAEFVVKGIESKAFSGCRELTSVRIHKNVSFVKESAFIGCSNLRSIIVDKENTVFDSREDCNAIIKTQNSRLVAGCKNTLIPQSIKSIGSCAFKGCTELHNITIPASVQVIGKNAFYGCTGLTDVFCLLKRITPFTDTDVEYYDAEPLDNKGITNGFDANIKNITLHVEKEFLESLYEYPSLNIFFEDFKDVVASENTVFILNYYVNNELYKSFNYKYREEVVPEPAPEKEGYTFSGWSEIPSVMPGKDVDVYGTFTANKYKLNYYVDGELYKTYEVACDAATIKEAEPTKENFEFSGWSEIPETMPAKDVDITGSFKRIAVTVDNVTYTFDGDNAIVTKDKGKSGDVILASSVESDGKTYSVVGIADNVFKDNTDITAVTIPDSMTSIGEYVFSGCKNIKTISIGSGIKNIGTRAFANIDKLTDVTVSAADVPETDRTAFESSYLDYVTLYVPYGLMEKYKSTGPWSGFKSVVAIEGTQRTFKVTYKIDDEEYKTVEVKEGEAIPTMADPTREGYTFSGWSDIPDVMPSQDVTVTGTFTINKYKLVYMVDGQEYKSYDVEYKSKLTPEENPTKEGYVFSGWSTIPETMPANDVTVTGSFSKGAYMLTYIVDGETYKTYSYDYGAVVTPEAYPEKEGYTFSGWDNVPGTMPAGNVTVTGFFTVNKYTITYYVDGEVYKTVEVEYGAKITAEEDPTKEGYDFSGWSWIPSKMPAEDVVIIGTFKQVDYEVDGGTFTIDDGEATLKGGGEAKGALVINNNVTINGKVYVVVNIGDDAFKGNKEITSVELPDGIKNIGAGAFDGCSSLLKVLLGKDVRKIGSKAFGNIWKAATTRTRAANDGFRVECNAESVPEIEADAFEGTEIEKATLVVQDELVNSYKTAEVWKNFGSIIGFTEATGVDGIFVDNPSAVIYSIDGRRLDKAQKGMNVIWTEKGVKKVVVR